MDAPYILATLGVELFVQYSLAVPVGVEVDAARGHDAGQVRAEAAEEGPESLVFVDGIEYLDGFLEVHVGRAGDRGESVFLRPGVGRVEIPQLSLVEVRLKARFEDVERRG